MNDLISRYSPRWLYLDEFMAALPGSDIGEKKEAVLMLIRDRLVVDGKLDETHFRFLGGKPQIEDAYWLANLSNDDISWIDSSFRASTADPDISREKWFLIEIAASGLTLFQTAKGDKPTKRPQRTPPEQTRALGVLKEIFKETIPSREHITDSDLYKRVNEHIGKNGRSISKDTVLRAAGRRK